jgi:hypothetical protein
MKGLLVAVMSAAGVVGLLLSVTASSASAKRSSGLAASPAIAQAAGLSAHGAPRKFGRSSSTSINWSGYAANKAGRGAYKSVSASWTQPSVDCATTPNGYSAFWAGLDGDFTSNTVEQTGTEADCSNGSPSYYAWYEMYPKASHNYTDTVLPGDRMTASVSYAGGGWFNLLLTDTRNIAPRGWTVVWQEPQHLLLSSAKRASAEAIAEAPSGAGGVLPLADFTSADFTGSSLAPLSPQAITMVTSSGTPKATPNAISSPGGGFTDTWDSAGP